MSLVEVVVVVVVVLVVVDVVFVFVFGGFAFAYKIAQNERYDRIVFIQFDYSWAMKKIRMEKKEA